MTRQPIFQTTRRSQYSWFESITEIGTLASTMIDGLGVFGLAANGMCPTLLARTTHLQHEGELSVGNGPTH